LLVVQRQLDRDERLLVGRQTNLAHLLPGVVDLNRSAFGEVLAAQGAVALFVLAVAVSVPVGLAVGLGAVAIAIVFAVGVPVCVSSLELRRITEQRDEDDA